MSEYIEENKELGLTCIWHNASIKDSIITHRNTNVEIVDRPNWGLTCYMDNCIQSCLSDEKIYHEALVHPVMSHSVKNVLIIGGGEGATAREVLKWPVENVDMYEWDRDVVELFKKYPQWAKGAWDDPRLHIFYEDVFELEYVKKYDAVIIDLFEPDYKMSQLLKKVTCSNIIMYAGMNYTHNQIINQGNMWRGISLDTTYKVYIPSFLGEAVFLHIKN